MTNVKAVEKSFYLFTLQTDVTTDLLQTLVLLVYFTDRCHYRQLSLQTVVMFVLYTGSCQYRNWSVQEVVNTVSSLQAVVKQAVVQQTYVVAPQSVSIQKIYHPCF